MAINGLIKFDKNLSGIIFTHNTDVTKIDFYNCDCCGKLLDEYDNLYYNGDKSLNGTICEECANEYLHACAICFKLQDLKYTDSTPINSMMCVCEECQNLIKNNMPIGDIHSKANNNLKTVIERINNDK